MFERWQVLYSMDADRLLTRSLRVSSHGKKITRCLSAALDAADPIGAVKRNVVLEDDSLFIGDKIYDLNHLDKVIPIGIGKASIPMMEAIIERLGDRFTSGTAITKTLPPQTPNPHPKLSILQAAHPIPDEQSLMSAQIVIDILSTTTENDLVIFLISGGGSALMTLPVSGVKLADIRILTNDLLSCGADITEINTLRKHLSQVKGGRLAKHAAPSHVVTLLLSDVIGDSLDVIASGPTVADPSTFKEALTVLEKYGIKEKAPANIVDHLIRGQNGEIDETPKVTDPVFQKTQNIVIGNNYQAAQAAIHQAKSEGMNTMLLTTSLEGEAKVAGRLLASITKQIDATGDPLPRPACVVAGGETTVTIQSDGKGGRNQEMALAAVKELAGLDETAFVTLATDGEDGPTDAAGGVVTGDTFAYAQSKELDPVEYLKRNDSYHFFKAIDDQLRPGSTGTNVCDLAFIFVF